MADERTTLINGLAEISDQYDAVLCDLWGCYHNGVTPFPAAVAALQGYRARGGKVVLLTNAPRPNPAVRRHLAGLNAPEDSFDAIVSSGDATRDELASGKWGRRSHIVGPDRDNSVWEGLDLQMSDLDQAEHILCTGLFDDTVETPADYADLVRAGVERDLMFLCANPDIIVDRGEERLYCAGAIAQVYEQAGGRTRYFGKPNPPIYDLAMRTVAEVVGRNLRKERVLAIGDGINTDVLGAQNADLDCLFVSGGLAAGELGDDPERPDPELLAQYLVETERSPRYTIGRLR